MNIAPKKPKDPVTADDFNKLLARIQALESPSGGRRVKLRSGPHGTSISGGEPSITHYYPVTPGLVYNAGAYTFLPHQVASLILSGGNAIDRSKHVIPAIDVPYSGDEGIFCILLENVPPGGTGRAQFMGVAYADVSNPNDKYFVDIEDGLTYLVGNENGSADVLWDPNWPNDGDGIVHICLVRFGAGGTKPVDPYVRIVNAAGSGVVGSSGEVDGINVIQGRRFLEIGPVVAPTKAGAYLIGPGLTWEYLDQPEIAIPASGDTNWNGIFFRFHSDSYHKASAAWK